MFRKLSVTVLLVVMPMLSFAENAEDKYTLSRGDSSSLTYYLESKGNDIKVRSLLLIVQGSDCNSVKSIKSIRGDLEKVSPESDILTVEKYGLTDALKYSPSAEREDCPKSYIDNDSPSKRVHDLMLVLNHLRAINKYKALIVIGGSEGAVVANMLASKVDYIDAVISFGTGGRKFVDDVFYSMALSGIPDAELKNEMRGFNEFVGHILNNSPLSLEVSNHGYIWWKETLLLDQYDVLNDISCPLLIVQGGKDESVSPKEVGSMVKLLEKTNKRNIKFKYYPELNHTLYPVGTGHIDPSAINYMASWLKQALKKKL